MRPFSTGDCLIEVTTLTDFTVYHVLETFLSSFEVNIIMTQQFNKDKWPLYINRLLEVANLHEISLTTGTIDIYDRSLSILMDVHKYSL